MKRLILITLTSLIASDAHAAGCDLAVGACYGEPGSSNNAGTLNCAAGGMLTLFATFEAAGTGPGCPVPVGIALIQHLPGSACAAPTTPLVYGTGPNALQTNSVVINGAQLPVAAKRRSWGALKSLYR